jgi:putative inorganic carbon (hco3(-)) transporter
MLFSGLLLFIFLQIIRPQDFVPDLQGVRLVLYLMVTLLIVLLFSPIEKKLFRSPQDKYAGMFFVAIVLSTLALFWFSYVVDTATEAMKTALMYYFIVMVVDKEDRFKKTIWAIIIFMGLVALMGVLQNYGYDITGAGMAFAKDKGIWQIKGIGNFDNPNDLAYSVVLVIPFALGFLFQTKAIIGRFIALVLLIISIYCIYLTKSRGGQVALAASLTSWLYFWTKNPKRKLQLVIFSITGVIAMAVVQSTGYREDESAMGRIEAWAEGWKLLKSNPIIGVGKEQFREHHKKDTHSSYVRAGAELGLLGLYAFMGMIYAVGLTILNLQKPTVDEKWRPYYAGFGAYFVSYTAASVFSTRTYDLIFLICVALVGTMGRLALADTDEVSTEGVLFPTQTARLWNKNVFGITTAVLVAWYLFLRQVW